MQEVNNGGVLLWCNKEHFMIVLVEKVGGPTTTSRTPYWRKNAWKDMGSRSHTIYIQQHIIIRILPCRCPSSRQQGRPHSTGFTIIFTYLQLWGQAYRLKVKRGMGRVPKGRDRQCVCIIWVYIGTGTKHSHGGCKRARECQYHGTSLKTLELGLSKKWINLLPNSPRHLLSYIENNWRALQK